jgi:5-methylthioribose kinase
LLPSDAAITGLDAGGLIGYVDGAPVAGPSALPGRGDISLPQMNMIEQPGSFQALTVETLAARLSAIAFLGEWVGPDARRWQVREVGDGNVNLVFVVEGDRGSVIVKQALPYFRLVGESWPLSLRRSFFEYQALLRQAQRAPGTVPAVIHFDERQAFIIMERLGQYVTLRRALIEGRQLPHVADDVGLFMARTLFRGSDFHMDARQRKDDLALFAGNVDLCAITEKLVFSDPYFQAPMNRHTTPQLDAAAAALRADRDLKVEAQRLKHIFATSAETLIHGDLHTGSIMIAGDSTKVIDFEFAFYGPMSFDVGILFGNLWMSFFSQAGHEQHGNRADMRRYVLAAVSDTWRAFCDEFRRLWEVERAGILYPRSVFEDQGDDLAAQQALDHVLGAIWHEMLGFAGLEIHRRIVGLAHVPDFEEIADGDVRARCETHALKFGRHLVLDARSIQSIGEVNALAATLDGT